MKLRRLRLTLLASLAIPAAVVADVGWQPHDPAHATLLPGAARALSAGGGGTVTECTAAAVRAAITAGGDWDFACDGRIVMQSSPSNLEPITVANHVTLNGAGRSVTLAGASNRRLFTISGTLTLNNVNVEDGKHEGKRGTLGVRGTNGVTASAPGSSGENAPNDPVGGGPGEPARGGCFNVEPTGRLVLRDLRVQRCSAIGGGGGYNYRGQGSVNNPENGAGGNGGFGRTGAAGVNGGLNPGTPGGDGGNGGNGASGAPGVDGADARGGAIYSEGSLDLLQVQFADNSATGGYGADGGKSGNGGTPGRGGNGGTGTPGANGGAPGTPGLPARGADAGNGGDAYGGAVYAVGRTSIVAVSFAGSVARGGDAGIGGGGGQGAPGASGGMSGLTGTYNGFIPGNSGADGGDNGDGGNASGGALVLAAGQPTPIGTVNQDNRVVGGSGHAEQCALGYFGVGCAGGGRACAGVVNNCPGTAGAKGKPGKDGAATLPDAASDDGLAGPAPFEIHNFGPGVYTFDSLLEVPEADQPLRESWDHGDGTSSTNGAHTYEKPGVYKVVSTVLDVHDRKYKSTKTLEVKAPELGLSISYEDPDLDFARLPLDKPVAAKVRVSASNGVGKLKGLTFGDGVVLQANPAERMDIEVEDAPEAFELEPGEARTFPVTLTGRTRGDAALLSSISGTDAADRAVSKEVDKALQVGEDLEVNLTAEPAEVSLEVDKSTNPPQPIAKPLTLEVAVKNVSGGPVEHVKLDLSPKVRTLVGRDPSAPFPLVVTVLHGRDGGPNTPLTNATAKDLVVGDMTNGSTKTLTFTVEARDKATVDMAGIARGVAAATEATSARNVSGTGTTPVRINQPTLLALTASGPRHGAVKAGQRWYFAGHVKNLSPDEDVTIFLRATKRENVAEGQLSELVEPDACGCGVFRRLTPGERLPVFGSVVASTTTAGTHGYLKMELAGKRHTYDDKGAPTDVPVGPAHIVVAAGADERTLSIDRNDPPTPAFDLTEAAFLMTDSAARTFGERLTGAWETASAAYAFAQTIDGAKLAAGLQQVATYVREEVPEAYQAAKEDMVRTLLAFDEQLDSGQALAIADEAFAKATIATVDAYHQTTWQDVSTKTGAILASHGPDLALEAVLPAIAACKLLKLGGKTAMARRAEKLAGTRAGRILSKGLKGLKPGDEISALLARKLWGVDGVIDSQLLNYAKEKGLMIAVRDRSPGSIRKLADGLLPKWEAVKAKNVSDLDVKWLGFHPSHLDTAMLKQMPDEADLVRRLQQAGVDEDEYFQVLARYDQRKQEWDGKDRMAMEAYERDGVIIRPTPESGLNAADNGIPTDNVFMDVDYELLRAGKKGDRSGDYLEATTDGLPAYQPRAHHNGQFRAMTGDMDPIAILDENGQILDLDRRREVYKDLAKMGFQHPESLTWDNPAGRAKYLWDYDINNALADALLVYHPDGTRRAGFFDSRKSRLDEDRAGFMAIQGADLKFGAAPPKAGNVPLVLPPETNPPVFLTPGGKQGANLSSTPGTRLIRRNPNGTFSEWTPERGWQPYTLAAGQTLTTLPQTAVRTEVKAGETRIDIADQSALILGPGAQAWFKPGDLVVLDPGGPNEEYVTVEALGSIIAAAALKKDHQPGEMVALVPRRPAAVVTQTPKLDPAVARVPAAPAATPPAPLAPLGRTALRLSDVKLAAKAFKRAKGTTLSLTLDRPATVSVALSRDAAGRRKGKACSLTAKKGKRCKVLTPAGATRVAGKTGKTTVPFGKGLKRGRYVATISAAGAPSVVIRFTVR